MIINFPVSKENVSQTSYSPKCALLLFIHSINSTVVGLMEFNMQSTLALRTPGYYGHQVYGQQLNPKAK